MRRATGGMRRLSGTCLDQIKRSTPNGLDARPDKDAPLLTIDAYLALERTEEERHEYLDGCVYAMAGESPDHGRICVNLTRRLAAQLDGSGCEVFSKDLKVRCGPLPRPGGSLQGLFAYPDLVVVCGALHFHDQARDVLLNPRVIVEVLSPSTESVRPGREVSPLSDWLPTLSDYVLVAQESPSLTTTTGRRRAWTLHALEGLQAHLHLETIGCTVSLAEVCTTGLCSSTRRRRRSRAWCLEAGSAGPVLCLRQHGQGAAHRDRLGGAIPSAARKDSYTSSSRMTAATTTPGEICKGHNSHNSPPRSSGVERPRSYPNICRIVGWTPCWRKRSCWHPGKETLRRVTVCTSAVRASWVLCSWSSWNSVATPTNWKWPSARS